MARFRSSRSDSRGRSSSGRSSWSRSTSSSYNSSRSSSRGIESSTDSSSRKSSIGRKSERGEESRTHIHDKASRCTRGQRDRGEAERSGRKRLSDECHDTTSERTKRRYHDDEESEGRRRKYRAREDVRCDYGRMHRRYGDDEVGHRGERKSRYGREDEIKKRSEGESRYGRESGTREKYYRAPRYDREDETKGKSRGSGKYSDRGDEMRENDEMRDRSSKKSGVKDRDERESRPNREKEHKYNREEERRHHSEKERKYCHERAHGDDRGKDYNTYKEKERKYDLEKDHKYDRGKKQKYSYEKERRFHRGPGTRDGRNISDLQEPRNIAEDSAKGTHETMNGEPLSEKSKPATQGAATRIIGAYVPPAKLRQIQSQITDKNSEEYQRLSWEALRKSINGYINKVNVSNIKNVVVELMKENIPRGKGLYCRCIMKSQAASPSFTSVYVALTAIINTKFPQVGELLIKRLTSQFRRGYKRGDKQVCQSSTKFLAHCVNQKLVHEILVLQLLTLLLESPTDSSIEIAVGLTRDCGYFLSENSPRSINVIFDRFRGILHEGNVEKRTQYMIEILFHVRKDKFKDNVATPEGLDLIEEEDQITHMITLDEEILDIEEECNVFSFDPDFLKNEEKYSLIAKEILGEGEGGSEEEDSDGDDDEDNDSDDRDQDTQNDDEKERTQIQDETDINNMNFRRAIYLTIMSSFSAEECAHKLIKLKVPPGKEHAFASMIIECCSVERIYISLYGLVAERFCRINKTWADVFTQQFEKTYKTIHRYEINLLRNIAKFFAHLIATDAISWEVFSLVRLTEADTTSSLRIFFKIIFQSLSEILGIKQLMARMKDPNMVVRVNTESGVVIRHVFDGTFPKDNPRNTRFAINYFTSIGLGALTDDLREYLKDAPKLIMSQKQKAESDEESDSDTSYSSSSGSYTGTTSYSGSGSYTGTTSYSCSGSYTGTTSYSSPGSRTGSHS